MAKGLRASSERANRRKLRTGVFGPVEKARADRLHAKMLEIIQSEKPAPPKNKGVDTEATTEATQDDLAKDMEVDGETDPAATSTSARKPNKKQGDRRSKKTRGPKARNAMTFPASKGKGALKPFTGSRVNKRK